MKIGITGANGFLGKELLRFLSRRDVESVPLVRAARGLPGERVVGPIDRRTAWKDALHDLDVVVHLAARVHMMKDAASDPLTEFREVNSAGTANLVKQCGTAGVRRFILMSTIKVNGEATALGRPFRADDPPRPGDPYSISKLEAEQSLFELASSYDMEAVVIRPPLVYGREAKGNFAGLAQLVRTGAPLPLGSVTSNRRSLIAAENLAGLIWRCVTHPGAANQVFLASDGQDLSTEGLLRAMGQAMGRKVRLIPVPVPLLKAGAKCLGKSSAADRLLGSLQVDIEKTQDLLEWTPHLSLEQTLRDALN